MHQVLGHQAYHSADYMDSSVGTQARIRSGGGKPQQYLDPRRQQNGLKKEMLHYEAHQYKQTYENQIQAIFKQNQRQIV